MKKILLIALLFSVISAPLAFAQADKDQIKAAIKIITDHNADLIALEEKDLTSTVEILPQYTDIVKKNGDTPSFYNVIPDGKPYKKEIEDLLAKYELTPRKLARICSTISVGLMIIEARASLGDETLEIGEVMQKNMPLIEKYQGQLKNYFAK